MLPSPKVKCPGAPLGLLRDCDVLRGGVTCESCQTAGTCVTSLRATRKKSPTLDMSWRPVAGKPSTISVMVGKPCCERGSQTPHLWSPQRLLYPLSTLHHLRLLTCECWPPDPAQCLPGSVILGYPQWSTPDAALHPVLQCQTGLCPQVPFPQPPAVQTPNRPLRAQSAD